MRLGSGKITAGLQWVLAVAARCINIVTAQAICPETRISAASYCPCGIHLYLFRFLAFWLVKLSTSSWISSDLHTPCSTEVTDKPTNLSQINAISSRIHLSSANIFFNFKVKFLHFVKYRLQPITPAGPAKTRHGPRRYAELICYSLVNDFTGEQCGTSTDDASNNSLLVVIVNMSVRRQPAHLLERLPIIVHSRSRRHRQPTRRSSVITMSSRSITVVASPYSFDNYSSSYRWHAPFCHYDIHISVRSLTK